MKIYRFAFLIAIAAMATAGSASAQPAPSTAGDLSNAAINVVDEQTFSLSGPFNHDNVAGDASNSTATANFAGGFSVNSVTISGEITPQPGSGTPQIGAPTTFDSNDDGIVVTTPSGGPTLFFDAIGAFSQTTPVTGAFTDTEVLTTPVTAAGDFTFEFVNTAPSVGVGPDSISQNVVGAFQNVETVDTTSVADLGTLNVPAGGEFDLELAGELALAGLSDQLTFTLDSAAELDVSIFGFATGFTGQALDASVGLFDSTDTLIAFDDTPFFTGFIEDIEAGDFTLVIAALDSNLSSGGVGSLNLSDFEAGTGIGNFTGSFAATSLAAAVPEPAVLPLMGTLALGLAQRRKRRTLS